MDKQQYDLKRIVQRISIFKDLEVEEVQLLLSQADRHSSTGLVSMEERAAIVGGRLAIESEPGKGATVRSCLPVVPATDHRPPIGEEDPP
ncbi:MAG: hypothetical protein QGI83_21770 [Candidatus Latescibacteria bacterium]|jgi:signal transduction histidine kinase|nr:hypothetical protein [Candidatus Latescibacterota bacterium]